MIIRRDNVVAAALELARPKNPPPRPTWIPSDFLTHHKVAAFTDMPAWLPEGGEMGGLHLTRVDRALKAGLQISPLRKTTRDTLAWHLARPAAERERLKAGIDSEREREVLTAWHAKDRGTPG